jgi:transposase-like protein
MKTFRELVDELRRLKNLDQPISLSSLPEEFQRDLRAFLVGETLTKTAGELMLSPSLLRRWVHKLFFEGGFDEEIDLKTLKF